MLTRSAKNFKAFLQLTHLHTLLHKLVFSPSLLSLSQSLCIFYALHHLYSWRPNSAYHEEMPHRPCGACFLPPQDTKEAITARRGQIGWGSYLGRIMFDILHHYQLPPFSPPQESYLSLADVPLSVMNFLCPPTSGPPYLSNPSSPAQGLQQKGGREARK